MEAVSDRSGVLARLRAGMPLRLRASGIHLAISAAIFAPALYLILVHWYPGFHFTVDGGWTGVNIMIAVDLVLGPLLTLIVFNPFKARRLIAFDLSCIGIAQAAALVWGFYAVHSQHPVAVSFHEDRFWPVLVEPLRIENTDPATVRALSGHRPALVYVAPPANDDEETRVAMQELVGGIAPHEDPFFFRRFVEHWPAVREKARPADALAKEDADFAAALPAFLAGRGGAAGDYLYFPYEGRYGACTLAFTREADLVGPVACKKY